jgi:hypothetical protein
MIGGYEQRYTRQIKLCYIVVFGVLGTMNRLERLGGGMRSSHIGGVFGVDRFSCSVDGVVRVKKRARTLGIYGRKVLLARALIYSEYLQRVRLPTQRLQFTPIHLYYSTIISSFS